MPTNASASTRARPQRNSRLVVMIVALAIGFASGALVIYQILKEKPREPIQEQGVVLSESTKTVLQQLRSPVEIRFYALFGAETPSENLRTLTANVNDLLSEFEGESGGKLTVLRVSEWSTANTKAAAADGVIAFDLDKGDPAYVGLTITQVGRKETMAQLAPEWAQAFEYDLARTIARVSSPAPAPRSPVDEIEAEKATAVVNQTIPNPAATSLEDGQQLLRESSLRDYQALVEEMNGKVQQGEKLVLAAASDKDRQAAVQRLQTVRATYADKLRTKALQSQAELEAWSQLKGP